MHCSTLDVNCYLYFNVHINIKIYNKSKTPSPIFFYIDLCCEIKWILEVEEKKTLIEASINILCAKSPNGEKSINKNDYKHEILS